MWIAAGGQHSVLLRSDGHAVACGLNKDRQCAVPEEDTVTYSHVAAGGKHTLLLQQDGCAFAVGSNDAGQCDIPALMSGETYVEVAAGFKHSVLLKNDGSAVACGSNGYGTCTIPALPRQCRYTQVAAGGRHSVLLRSDGQAVGCGDNSAGECDFPPLQAALSYIQVAAGKSHTLLLRSDGVAVACGSDEDGQCQVPRLPPGVTYTQISAGSNHSAFLRSDGTAIACGSNVSSQCTIPDAEAGARYVQVAAGGSHTLLLTSTGKVVACGIESRVCCHIPRLPGDLSYGLQGGGAAASTKKKKASESEPPPRAKLPTAARGSTAASLSEEDSRAAFMEKPLRVRQKVAKACAERTRETGRAWKDMSWAERLAAYNELEESILLKLEDEEEETTSSLSPKAQLGLSPTDCAAPDDDTPSTATGYTPKTLPERGSVTTRKGSTTSRRIHFDTSVPATEDRDSGYAAAKAGQADDPISYRSTRSMLSRLRSLKEDPTPEKEKAAAEVQPSLSKTKSAPVRASGRGSTMMERMSQVDMVEYSIEHGDLELMANGEAKALKDLYAFRDLLCSASSFGTDVEVHRFLAKGTAGWVFLTEHKKKKEANAMKLIRLSQARSGVKEWFISKRMREANVDKVVLTYDEVYVIDRDADDTSEVIKKELRNAGPVRYYMALFQDLMPWGTIEDKALHGQLSLEVMFKALLDVADTLMAMHAANVQHRDVKPENIMLQYDKASQFVCGKLCDLGSATVGQEEIGEKDDFRRWGVTLFSAATGEPWTKNRLMHEKHDALVERLGVAVQGCGIASLEKLPSLLKEILDGTVTFAAARKQLGDLAGGVM
eukprot:TRINITY_DN45504_c0_g1_i1.p1 TRINITY_DN45504_c0_g1~~TRINITY_DN45504_c0_g1_i1.p1  ORF type:complete len:850 (+),score=231.25 TRINITY_DN45504_c0_g1_i1:55-2550(+)